MQSQQAGFAGTALAAFGSADSGVPATVIAPSLLLDEVEVHGARGEPRTAAAGASSADVISASVAQTPVCGMFAAKQRLYRWLRS